MNDVVGHWILREIHAIFRTEGWHVPDQPDEFGTWTRRNLVEAYNGSIDFAAGGDAQAYLRVVSRVLEQLERVAGTGGWEGDAASRQVERLIRELDRGGINRDGVGDWSLPDRVVVSRQLSSTPDESGIRIALKALERMDAEPEERIGAAKELVESTIKHALDELGEAYGQHDDIPDLAKQLHSRLKLTPSGVAPTARGAKTIMGVLTGLTKIPVGLAELRNEGYGTGHGRSKRIKGVKARHADLAVGTAIAYATFILATISDPDAPWR